MRVPPASTRCRLLAALVLTAVTLSVPAGRPRDPWVFRCVLDRQPRMVVIALHEHLWVAYDATASRFSHAWDGDVDFRGSVYTTEHGPQPTTRGTPRLDATPEPDWVVRRGREKVAHTIAWKGYRFDGDRVILRAEIRFDDGTIASLTDSPEVVRDGERVVGLERRLSVTGLPGGVTVAVPLALTDASRRPLAITVDGTPVPAVRSRWYEAPIGADTTITIRFDAKAGSR